MGRLYVDGTLVASDTFTAPAATKFPLYFGSYYHGGYGWKGAEDEVRLYNRVLTTSEVSGIYIYTGGSSDTTPPTTPGNVVATAVSSSKIIISWSASTDYVSVTGYQVFPKRKSGGDNELPFVFGFRTDCVNALLLHGDSA